MKMKKLIKLSIIVLTCSLISSSHAQTKDNQCSIMHEGTFFYGKKKRINQMIVIKDNILTENWGYGQFIMTSSMTWINDCEYISTTLKVSKPNSKYNVGDRMHVKITKVVDNKIYYTASRNSYDWNGYLIKKKKE